jgi:hypothetical protein
MAAIMVDASQDGLRIRLVTALPSTGRAKRGLSNNRAMNSPTKPLSIEVSLAVYIASI